MKFKYLSLLFLTFALGVSLVWWNESYRITSEKINQLIEKEIPQEATFAQVESFLDSHNIPHSDAPYSIYMSYPNRLDQIPIDSDFENNPKLDGKRSRIKTLVGAIIRNTEQGLFMSWGISLRFYFDEQENLVEYTVEKYSTGM